MSFVGPLNTISVQFIVIHFSALKQQTNSFDMLRYADPEMCPSASDLLCCPLASVKAGCPRKALTETEDRNLGRVIFRQ